MSTPKIHGLPPLPEGYEFLLEGETRRKGTMKWTGAHEGVVWEPQYHGDDLSAPMHPERIYCAPIRKPAKRVPLTAEDWTGEGCWWVRSSQNPEMMFHVYCVRPEGILFRGKADFDRKYREIADTYSHCHDL